MGEPRLAVEGVSVARGRRRVVADVSFTARAGDVTALLGPNGAGKSTVLKAIAGVLPHEGRVRLDGVDAATLPRRARAQRIAYVPQHSALEAPLPVREVVELGRFPHGEGLGTLRADDRRAVDEAMRRTDVASLADHAFNTLSYGERRRVLLARALATTANVLLLDEPTAALDVGHALGLLAVLRALAAGGAAVVVVLHQLQEAAEIASRAVLLADGRCVLAGETSAVIAPGPVRAVYGVEMRDNAQFACHLPGEGAR